MKTSQHLLWIGGLIALGWLLWGRKSASAQTGASRPASSSIVPGALLTGSEETLRSEFDAYVARGGTMAFGDWQRDRLTFRTAQG